ncbi:unnamed protein product [Cylicocyclus nassatus]|uniref:Uncharacterized protein n=1 Tax=Cylicocyclus nassatus TaxID=53992 RepID=A0AA36HHX0_CYLNA|nr:unnamed protein product [Cylicocyclus nassatus]
MAVTSVGCPAIGDHENEREKERHGVFTSHHYPHLIARLLSFLSTFKRVPPGSVPKNYTMNDCLDMEVLNLKVVKSKIVQDGLTSTKTSVEPSTGRRS